MKNALILGYYVFQVGQRHCKGSPRLAISLTRLQGRRCFLYLSHFLRFCFYFKLYLSFSTVCAILCI